MLLALLLVSDSARNGLEASNGFAGLFNRASDGYTVCLVASEDLVWAVLFCTSRWMVWRAGALGAGGNRICICHRASDGCICGCCVSYDDTKPGMAPCLECWPPDMADQQGGARKGLYCCPATGPRQAVAFPTTACNRLCLEPACCLEPAWNRLCLEPACCLEPAWNRLCLEPPAWKRLCKVKLGAWARLLGAWPRLLGQLQWPFKQLHRVRRWKGTWAALEVEGWGRLVPALCWW